MYTILFSKCLKSWGSDVYRTLGVKQWQAEDETESDSTQRLPRKTSHNAQAPQVEKMGESCLRFFFHSAPPRE